jgi:phospholipase C
MDEGSCSTTTIRSIAISYYEASPVPGEHRHPSGATGESVRKRRITVWFDSEYVRLKMSPGLVELKHVIVLMMKDGSFDHMLGSFKKVNPAIDRPKADEWNPDSNGSQTRVAPRAKDQRQFDPDPDHDFDGVNEQIFNGAGNPE